MKRKPTRTPPKQEPPDGQELSAAPFPFFRGDEEPAAFWRQPAQHFALIVAVAAIVRVVHFLALRANDPSFGHLLAGVDTKSYDDLALMILGGDWMLSGKPVHYMGPLYAYLLAGVYGIFGHSYAAAHAAQFAMGGLAAGVLYLAARHWFSNRVAFIAGMLAGLSATLLVYEGFLLPEGMIFFLTTVFLYALGRARLRSGQWWRWPLLGIALGLIAIQRANVLLLAPALAAWIFFAFCDTGVGKRMLWIGLLAAGVVATLAPVTLHNRVFGGQWVLVTSNGPVNLYIGNGKDAPGIFGETTHYQQHARQIAAGEGSWRGYLLSEIAAEPMAWLGLMLKKAYMYWGAYDIPDNFNYHLYKRFSPATAAGQFSFYVVAAAGLAGMAMTWGRRREVWELYLFALVSMLSIAMVFISGRFRLPVFAVMAMFASLAAWRCFELAAARRFGKLGLIAAALGVVSIVLNLYRPEVFRVRPNDFGMLAAYYDMAGQGDEALELLESAEKYFETPARGDEKFEQARVTSLYFTRSSLANRLAQAGRVGEAVTALEKQVETGAYDLNMVKMLLYGYIETGNRGGAINVARQLAQIEPGNPEWASIAQQLETQP